MKQKDFAIGLICGFAAGAAAALLLAPASGVETRRRLRFERDNAVEAARLQAARARTRLGLAEPGEEGVTEEVEEEEGGAAFIGA